MQDDVFEKVHSFEIDNDYSILKPEFCNVCHELIVSLFGSVHRCIECDFVTHAECVVSSPSSCTVSLADSLLKDDVVRNQILFKHHWIRGNVKATSCDVCDSSFFLQSSAESSGCSRCKLAVHEVCKSKINPVCQPPHDKLLWLNTNNDQLNENRTPLLCFVNSRSGGGQGILIAKELSKILDRNQVWLIDSNHLPADGLRKFKSVKNLRILVCGGDGTVNWILSCLEIVKHEMVSKNPPVAVLPLGTGNDLAQTLGWVNFASLVPPPPSNDNTNSRQFNNKRDQSVLSNLLYAVETAEEIQLDRWLVSVDDGALLPREQSSAVMTNYLSFGVDAQVALKFHLLRESHSELFVSQTVNKLFYAHFGFTTMFDGIEDIGSKVDVICDDVKLQLPEEISGIIVLNIPSYAGGADLWGEDDENDNNNNNNFIQKRKIFKTPSVADGMLEVVAVTSSMHMGIISVNLSHAIRVTQCSKLELIFNQNSIPFQIDGEPTLRDKSRLTIRRASSVPMLLCREELTDFDEPIAI